ncbi:MAG: ATP-binding protein [Burkholderiales bacterium]
MSDTGIGIPKAEQGRIFQRFYRLDKARSRAEAEGEGVGAGLGLSIAQWIAQAHGGSLSLTSSGPQGSLFTVLLPWAEEAISPGRAARPLDHSWRSATIGSTRAARRAGR